MSAIDKLKGNKKLIIIAAGVVVIVVALIVFVLPNIGQQEAPQPEAVAKRVKIDLKPQAAPGAPQVAANGATVTATTAKPGDVKPAATAAPLAPAEKPAHKPVETAKAVTEQTPATAAKKESKAHVSSKPWAVNLSSFITSSEANTFKKKLKASGYKAYVSKYEKDGMTWHRVRVGFYRTKAEAKQAGKKIAAKFKIEHEPWILKASKTELAKYAK